MSTYYPRYDEIHFALNVWSEMPGLQTLPGLEGQSADIVSAVIDEAGRFASQVLAPLDTIGDREGTFIKDGCVCFPEGWKNAYNKFVEAQWNTVHFPEVIGGQGFATPVSVAVSEMFNSANISFSLGLMPFSGVVSLLAAYGTERQKRIYLPALVSGRWTATLAITEPQAGTDLGAIKTKAEKDAAGYRIKGTKCFITYGDHDMAENIVHFVLARGPGNVAGIKGLSLYVVSKFEIDDEGKIGSRNDVQCISLEKKIGVRASPTATMTFGDGQGAVGELLGEENRGLAHMFLVLNRARLNIAVFGLASAENAYQAALSYAQERIQGSDRNGRPCAIIDHPDVRRMLQDMRASTDAMRAIAYYTAGVAERAQRELDESLRSMYKKRLDLLTPIAKGWVTENGFLAASTGVQVAGGAGYLEESRASQYFRDARVHTIYEGTTGVQSMDLVLRKVLRDEGESALLLLNSMLQEVLVYQHHDSVRDEVALLSDAIARLKDTTEWILGQGDTQRESLEAISAHYLNFWGTVLGAWLLIKGVVASTATESDLSLANSFVDNKRSAMRYFLVHRLMPACSLKDVIVQGASSITCSKF